MIQRILSEYIKTIICASHNIPACNHYRVPYISHTRRSEVWVLWIHQSDTVEIRFEDSITLKTHPGTLFLCFEYADPEMETKLLTAVEEALCKK